MSDVGVRTGSYKLARVGGGVSHFASVTVATRSEPHSTPHAEPCSVADWVAAANDAVQSAVELLGVGDPIEVREIIGTTADTTESAVWCATFLAVADLAGDCDWSPVFSEPDRAWRVSVRGPGETVALRRCIHARWQNFPMWATQLLTAAVGLAFVGTGSVLATFGNRAGVVVGVGFSLLGGANLIGAWLIGRDSWLSSRLSRDLGVVDSIVGFAGMAFFGVSLFVVSLGTWWDGREEVLPLSLATALSVGLWVAGGILRRLSKDRSKRRRTD